MAFTWPNGVEWIISGSGALYAIGDAQSTPLACTFHAIQFSSSACHLECAFSSFDVDTPSVLGLMFNQGIFRLAGRTECGEIIAADTVTYSGDFLTRSEGRLFQFGGLPNKEY